MKTNLTKAFLGTFAALAAMLALGSGIAEAADMCFKDDYNSVLVGKRFKFPRPGDCGSFNGYEIGTNCILTGTACGTSNGADIRFNLNVSCPNGIYIGTSYFRLDRLYHDLNQAGFGQAYSPNTQT